MGCNFFRRCRDKEHGVDIRLYESLAGKYKWYEPTWVFIVRRCKSGISFDVCWKTTYNTWRSLYKSCIFMKTFTTSIFTNGSIIINFCGHLQIVFSFRNDCSIICHKIFSLEELTRERWKIISPKKKEHTECVPFSWKILIIIETFLNS